MEDFVPIDGSRIRELIPHAGSMCLLHQVIACTPERIECLALSHRDAENPLRHNGGLPIHAGVEYCAQAIAVHGRLTQGGGREPRRGYLAVVLNTEWRIERLDTCAGPLHVAATKQVVLEQGVSYAFELKHDGATILRGQAVVALE